MRGDKAMSSRISPAAIVIAVLLGSLGCGRDPLAGRRSLDLDQALHGHWSSTKQLDLASAAGSWDIENATQRSHIEIDRYIDARAEPKTWIDQEYERHWQSDSADPGTGDISVTTWTAGRPTNPSNVKLRFNEDRTVLLEKLPSTNEKVSIRVWTYINDQAIP